MKITDRLVGDHKTFRKMAENIESIASAPPAARGQEKLIRLAELFKDHLILHSWFEDVFYYPAVRQALSRAPSPLLSGADMDLLEKEHKAIDGLVDRLEREVKSSPVVGSWPETYALFRGALWLHMEKEENVLFPLSEKLLGAPRLEALSLEMELHRKEAPKVRLHARES